MIDLRTDRLAMLPGQNPITTGHIPHILDDLWYRRRQSAAGFDGVGEAVEDMVGVADTVHHGQRAAATEILDQR